MFNSALRALAQGRSRRTSGAGCRGFSKALARAAGVADGAQADVVSRLVPIPGDDWVPDGEEGDVADEPFLQ